jgi:hypothetical protein
MADVQGHGTVLTADTTTSFAASTTIGLITSISGPNQTADSVETTDFQSTAAEFDPGLKDPGELTVELKYDVTNAAAVRALEARSDTTNTPLFFKIRFNESTATANCSSFYCKGMITALGHAIPNDGIITQTATIKLSGKPVRNYE